MVTPNKYTLNRWDTFHWVYVWFSVNPDPDGKSACPNVGWVFSRSNTRFISIGMSILRIYTVKNQLVICHSAPFSEIFLLYSNMKVGLVHTWILATAFISKSLTISMFVKFCLLFPFGIRGSLIFSTVYEYDTSSAVR